MSELNKKLLAAQVELKAPKGQFNKFGKYKYRSAEDILEAVKPINQNHGLTLTLSDEPILIGDWHYIKATATIHDGESEKSVTAYARESENKKGMDHSQITGTASSYARKYALNGLYLIDDTKDADTDEYTEKTQDKTITQKQYGELKTLSMKFAQMNKKSDRDVHQVLLENKVISNIDITQITENEAKLAIAQVKGWIEKQEKKAESK